jgi:hypothetical protein
MRANTKSAQSASHSGLAQKQIVYATNAQERIVVEAEPLWKLMDALAEAQSAAPAGHATGPAEGLDRAPGPEPIAPTMADTAPISGSRLIPAKNRAAFTPAALTCLAGHYVTLLHSLQSPKRARGPRGMQLNEPCLPQPAKFAAAKRYKKRYKRPIPGEAKKRNCPRGNDLRHAGSWFSGEDRIFSAPFRK